jgi:hypothetical protein
MSPSWEAASCAAIQEFPNILWHPKVHCRVHKSPTLVPVLSQINSVQTILSYPVFLRATLILSPHLRFGIPSALIPSGFHHKLIFYGEGSLARRPTPNLEDHPL